MYICNKDHTMKLECFVLCHGDGLMLALVSVHLSFVSSPGGGADTLTGQGMFNQAKSPRYTQVQGAPAGVTHIQGDKLIVGNNNKV